MFDAQTLWVSLRRSFRNSFFLSTHFYNFFRGTEKARAQGKETPARPTHKARQAPRERHSHEARKAAGLAFRLASVMGSQVCAEPSGGSGVAIACTTGVETWSLVCRPNPDEALPLGCRPGSMASATLRELAEPLSPWALRPTAPMVALTAWPVRTHRAPGERTWEACSKTGTFPMHAMQECLSYDANSHGWARGPGPTLRLKEGRSCGGIDIKVHTTN